MEKEKQEIHHEDLALKTAAQYFGEELMPLMGISGAIALIAPTESVKLEARQMYQDFNYVMADNGWVHLEFESDSITLEDLRRFREYEAATSRAHKVAVTTCVICSSRVERLKTELAEGINVYRVRAIRMQDQDADHVFSQLKEKQERGEKLRKADLVPLLLTPLMSGRLSVEDRIVKSLKILQKEESAVTEREREKMQAVLYTFADKFLNARELERVKEMIAMTRLGKMLVEDGFKQGVKHGIEQGIGQGMERGIALTKRILRLSASGCAPEQIARDCGIGLKEVNHILKEDDEL